MRRASTFPLLPLVFAGCGELIGADDYASAEPELPYNGFFDHLGGKACRACMLKSCQAALDLCTADLACAEYLECYTTQPGMRLACRAPVSFELIDVGAVIASCWTGCRQACNTGRVWSCNREFDASVSEPGATGAKCLVSYVDALTGAPISGLDVRACRRDDAACAAPQSSPAPATDANGRTSIEVKWPPQSPISPKPGFDGYLELTSKTIAPPWWPFLRFTATRELGDFADAAVMFNGNDPKVKLAFLAAAGIQIDTSLSGFAAEVVDCLGMPAPGVRFEVTLEPGNQTVPLVYLDAQGNLDPSLTVTSTSGIAFGANLVGESGKIVARFADTGEVIRERPFVLRAGATHSLVIQPAPKDE